MGKLYKNVFVKANRQIVRNCQEKVCTCWFHHCFDIGRFYARDTKGVKTHLTSEKLKSTGVKTRLTKNRGEQ